MKSIAIVACCDTKYHEIQYMADFIRNAGHRPLVVDISTGPNVALKADITREEVLREGGWEWEDVHRLPKSEAIAAMSAKAEEPVPATWLGSAKIVASVPFAAPDEAGLEAETRLIFDSKPESGVGFRAEGGIRWTYGSSSEEAVAFAARLAAAPVPEDLPPGEDLHRVLFLDQAYAEAALGRADLSFGIVPLAWGTGYVFNPTARTAPPHRESRRRCPSCRSGSRSRRPCFR